jgi:hypothetical protein
VKVVDVYMFYNEYVKPIYSEVEAGGNELPVELLFEIHSCFDHLKRYYLGDDAEEHACEKAISHLKRGVLDAFKLKLKQFNIDVGQVQRSGTDLALIDTGNYLARFLKEKKEIIDLAKEARISEGIEEKQKAFDKWTEASLKIDSFYKEFIDESKLTWARKKTIKLFSLNTLIGFGIGLASSAVVAAVFFFVGN